MADDTQEELQRLRDKNRELLEEKRRARAERDDLAERLEAVTAERDEAAAEVRRITVENPRRELVESLTVDGMAEPAMREIQHHVTIEDDGTLTAGGEPVTNDEGEPLRFDAEGIKALHESGKVPALRAMLRGNGSSGGGAPGALSSMTTPRHEKTTQQAQAPRRFGLQ